MHDFSLIKFHILALNINITLVLLNYVKSRKFLILYKKRNIFVFMYNKTNIFLTKFYCFSLFR